MGLFGQLDTLNNGFASAQQAAMSTFQLQKGNFAPRTQQNALSLGGGATGGANLDLASLAPIIQLLQQAMGSGGAPGIGAPVQAPAAPNPMRQMGAMVAKPFTETEMLAVIAVKDQFQDNGNADDGAVRNALRNNKAAMDAITKDLGRAPTDKDLDAVGGNAIGNLYALEVMSTAEAFQTGAAGRQADKPVTRDSNAADLRAAMEKPRGIGSLEAAKTMTLFRGGFNDGQRDINASNYNNGDMNSQKSKTLVAKMYGLLPSTATEADLKNLSAADKKIVDAAANAAAGSDVGTMGMKLAQMNVQATTNMFDQTTGNSADQNLWNDGDNKDYLAARAAARTLMLDVRARNGIPPAGTPANPVTQTAANTGGATLVSILQSMLQPRGVTTGALLG